MRRNSYTYNQRNLPHSAAGTHCSTILPLPPGASRKQKNTHNGGEGWEGEGASLRSAS